MTDQPEATLREPSTAAGQDLLRDLTDLDTTGAAPTAMYLGPFGVRRAILAIEAKARASERQRVEALRQAAETYFDATASEPLQGGPPPVAYIRARDANRRQARYELQLLLGRSEDTPRWWREHVASPTPEPRPAPLDVERLAEAMATVRDPYPNDQPIWAIFDEPTRDMFRRDAAAIAREYARLTATGQETGE